MKNKKKTKPTQKSGDYSAVAGSTTDSTSEAESEISAVKTNSFPARLPILSSDEYEFFELIKNGDLKSIKGFIDSSRFPYIDVKKPNKNGETALEIAIRRQDPELIKLLLKQGLQLSSNALLLAIKSGSIDTVTLILHLPDAVPQSNSESLISEPMLAAAQSGNFQLMEMIHGRGMAIENSKEHHKIRCPCSFCTFKSKYQENLSHSFLRLELFKALTNPGYVCFSAIKYNRDPIEYAFQKIIQCREIASDESALEGEYYEMQEQLENFATEMLGLCENSFEAEIFLSIPQKEPIPFTNSPRLWNAVQHKFKKFISHPHAQAILYREWCVQDWPEWDSYSSFRKFVEFISRIIFFPFICLMMWLIPRGPFVKKLLSPISRFLNFMASETIFLTLLLIQTLLPYQRCNDGFEGRGRYTVKDEDCKQSGPPQIGTEPLLMLFVIGFCVSILKRSYIPWYWHVSWSWYELFVQSTFFATFGFWLWAWLVSSKLSPEERHAVPRSMWSSVSPEILGECCLSVATIATIMKLSRIFQLNPFLGPLQLSLCKMVFDVALSIIFIMTLLLAFSAASSIIYIPYDGMEGINDDGEKSIQSEHLTDFWSGMEFWVWGIFGLSDRTEGFIISFPNPLNGEENHHYLNEFLGVTLYGFFLVIAVLNVMNLLVGFVTDSMNVATEQADIQWRFQRSKFYMSFMADTELPPPFNIVPSVRKIRKIFELIVDFKSRQSKQGQDTSKTQLLNFKKRHYGKLIQQLIYRYNGLSGAKEGAKTASEGDINELEDQIVEIKSRLAAVVAKDSFIPSSSVGSKGKKLEPIRPSINVDPNQGTSDLSRRPADAAVSAPSDLGTSSNASEPQKNSTPAAGNTISAPGNLLSSGKAATPSNTVASIEQPAAPSSKAEAASSTLGSTLKTASGTASLGKTLKTAPGTASLGSTLKTKTAADNAALGSTLKPAPGDTTLGSSLKTAPPGSTLKTTSPGSTLKTAPVGSTSKTASPDSTLKTAPGTAPLGSTLKTAPGAAPVGSTLKTTLGTAPLGSSGPAHPPVRFQPAPSPPPLPSADSTSVVKKSVETGTEQPKKTSSKPPPEPRKVNYDKTEIGKPIDTKFFQRSVQPEVPSTSKAQPPSSIQSKSNTTRTAANMTEPSRQQETKSTQKTATLTVAENTKSSKQTQQSGKTDSKSKRSSKVGPDSQDTSGPSSSKKI